MQNRLPVAWKQSCHPHPQTYYCPCFAYSRWTIAFWCLWLSWKVSVDQCSSIKRLHQCLNRSNCSTSLHARYWRVPKRAFGEKAIALGSGLFTGLRAGNTVWDQLTRWWGNQIWNNIQCPPYGWHRGLQGGANVEFIRSSSIQRLGQDCQGIPSCIIPGGSQKVC